MLTLINSITSEVELNKLVLIRPTLLLKYDNLIIDKRDYEEICSKSESYWNQIHKKNLLFLETIGAIHVIDYNKYLDDSEKSLVFKRGNEIVKNLEREQKRKLLIHAWKDFQEYLNIKLFFLQNNETLFSKQWAFKEYCMNHYNSILNNNWDVDLQDMILKNCIWKTYSSMVISSRLTSSNLHLAHEYSPFFDLIFEKSQSNRIQQVDQLIKHIYSLSLPSVQINSFDEQKGFIELRKKHLNKYKELCAQLEAILNDHVQKGIDIEQTKAFLTERWNYGVFAMDGFFSKIKNLSLLPEYLIDVLIKTLVHFKIIPVEPPNPSTLGKNQLENIASRKLTYLKKSPVNWQAVFCSVFNEREINRIKKELRKPITKSSSNELDYWLLNPDKKRWYIKE